MSPPQHFMEQLDQEKRYPAATQDQEITDETTNSKDGYDKEAQTVVTTLDDSSVNSSRDPANTLPPVPLQMKLLSVLLVSCIGFGSQWSSGVSSAMKSTMKKVYNHPSSSVLRTTNFVYKGNAHQQYPILPPRS